MTPPNRLSMHSLTYLPQWSTEGGRYVVERAAATGFGQVVVPMRDPATIEPAAVAAIFEQAGLTPIATANQRPDADISSLDPEVRAAGLKRLRLSLGLARDFGARHLGGILYGVLGKASAAASPDNFSAAADGLATLADEAAGMGIRLAIEIVNRYETNLVTTVERALELLDATGSSNLYLHLDTFHMAIEEDSMLDALERALPRLAYFELDQSNRGPLDKGNIDFAPLLAQLRSAGYEGYIGVEAFSSAISDPQIAASVAAWRNLYEHGDVVAHSAIRVLKEAGFVPG